MGEFLNKLMEAAHNVLVNEHGFVKEDGILLAPSTVEIVKELEEMNRQRLIEQALINGNKKLFMQLTGGE